jgi:DNA-binding response OmpR family regulator
MLVDKGGNMHQIAVVEDDSLMHKLFKSIFQAPEFQLRIWDTGRPAIDAIPAEQPDLVLLDVNLPDMTGHDVCRALKSDPRSRDIPVLMLTGEALAVEYRVQGLELGADDYLFKPISPKVLLARVTSILRSRGSQAR